MHLAKIEMWVCSLASGQSKFMGHTGIYWGLRGKVVIFGRAVVFGLPHLHPTIVYRRQAPARSSDGSSRSKFPSVHAGDRKFLHRYI